jgi:hypothetical protein
MRIATVIIIPRIATSIDWSLVSLNLLKNPSVYFFCELSANSFDSFSCGICEAFI